MSKVEMDWWAWWDDSGDRPQWSVMTIERRSADKARSFIEAELPGVELLGPYPSRDELELAVKMARAN